MGMTFGIHIGPQNISIEDTRRLWRHADENGYTWVSVWDHFYGGELANRAAPHFEALTLMSAIACETRNVKIGCLVFCIAYRNPAVLTKSLITIDHLSGGRLEPGLGAGWHRWEFEGYGIPFLGTKQRLDMLEEGTRVVKSLLENEITDHHGTYYTMNEAKMTPKPLQAHMPLWIGGGGERRTLRIAARYADGWNVPYIGADAWARKSAILDEWCQAEGRDPASIQRTINLHFNMAATNAEGGAVTQRIRELYGEDQGDRIGGRLLGGPDEVVEQIRAFERVGVTHLNIAFRPPVDWASLEVFTREVMPRFG